VIAAVSLVQQCMELAGAKTSRDERFDAQQGLFV